MFKSKIAILLLIISVTVSFSNASPVFEPSDNLVEDTIANDNDDTFERANDGFENMNDFNFEESPPGSQQDVANNQSAEQTDEESPPSHNVRERHTSEINKATAEEEPETGIDDGSNEARGEGNRESNSGRKQKYAADNDENAARSLDFEPFDKESDDANNKNEFGDTNGSGETNGRSPMMTRPMIGGNGPSDDENNSGPRNGPPVGLPMPLLEQIDEPIIVNPALPLPMHGRSARGNSEENGGGKYKSKEQRNQIKQFKNTGAPGSETDQSELKDYKFLPGGIKYLHETSVSKSRVAPHPLASYAVDHSAAVESEEQAEEQGEDQNEENLEPSMRDYMQQWIQNFERDPNLLNALGNSVQNINYGFENKRK